MSRPHITIFCVRIERLRLIRRTIFRWCVHWNKHVPKCEPV